MARRAVPQKGIEYTFKFKNGNLTHLTTLIYEGINEKGRYEFYNKQSKAYTSMPPKRFAYIHRFNLAGEKPIIGAKKAELQEVPKHLIEDYEIPAVELKDTEKKFIDRIRALTGSDRERFAKAVGKGPEAFIIDLLSKNGNEDVGVAYLRAYSFIYNVPKREMEGTLCRI